MSKSTDKNSFSANPAESQAAILASALPFMQRYEGKIIVIKYGGSALEGEAAKFFAHDVVLLRQSGLLPVVVHGGGKQISAMLKRLNIDSQFKDGLRKTTKEIAEVTEMVLAGSINKKITNDIIKAGGRGVGISGRDGDLIKIKPHAEEALGFVGEPEHINKEIIMTLLGSGFIPVVAPTASEKGEIYNVNADSAASAIAAHLGAVRLLMMTDVAGLLDESKTLIPSLSADNAQALLLGDSITDGMRPKIETAVNAVRQGVEAAVILNGKQKHALLLELFTPHGIGTMIK